MRQVTLQMSMSLDGYVASDREHPGTAVPEDAELVRWKLDRVAKAGAHLMGRTTYEEMAGYWPHSEHPYAAPMNDIPKIVFSASLREGSWPTTRIARGDLAAESAAIKEVFGERAYAVPVSATKSMHGHLLGATGALELALALVTLKRGVLLPTMHLQVPAPDCDLDYVPNAARRGVTVRTVMSSSFAFGGTNAVLIASAAPA